MKKAILVLSMLFVVSQNYSQANQSTVEQMGDSNYTEILQIGDENNSYVSLIGWENTATVHQEGTFNQSRIEIGYYDGVTLIEDWQSKAHVVQIGYNNSLEVLQWSGAPGEWNFTSIDQYGDGNYAFNEQDLTNQKFTLSQEGNFNVADVRQFGGENNTGVIQVGDRNISDVRQGYSDGSTWEGAFNNEIFSDQIGNNNYFQSIQDEGAHNSLSNVVQQGDFNSVIVNQKVGELQAEVTQEGNDNIANIFQEEFYAISRLAQVGEGNNFESIQIGGAYSEVIQTGNWNSSIVDQRNGEIESRIFQTGESNISNVIQDGDFILSSTINQDGISNNASLIQNGWSHYSTINQIGNSNTVSVVQNNL